MHPAAPAFKPPAEAVETSRLARSIEPFGRDEEAAWSPGTRRWHGPMLALASGRRRRNTKTLATLNEIVPLATLRGAVGYVPQETFLFSRTIAENIALGRPDAAEEDIHRMAELSKLADEAITPHSQPRSRATGTVKPAATMSGAWVRSTADLASLKSSSGFVRICSGFISTDTLFIGFAIPSAAAS
jgi:hypothetical protein